MRTRVVPGFAVVIAAVASVLLSGTLPAGASDPAGTARPTGRPGSAALVSASSNSPGHFHYNYNLAGVSAISRFNAWAVGSYSAAGISHTLSLHWNGKTWTRVPVPDFFDASLNAVSAVSPRDVWAVGEYYPPARRRRSSR